jgi:hypothetical protein
MLKAAISLDVQRGAMMVTSSHVGLKSKLKATSA